MYDKQDKTQEPTSSSESTETIAKVAYSPVASTRQPGWTQAMGDHIPVNLQAKLTVSQPGDAYEQEADRVADQVMRMPAAGPTMVREDTSLMRKESSGASSVQGAPPIIKQTLSSGGQPLDTSVRATMESRFGQDFSGVRVHTDERAAESAQVLNARAYTVGKDVIFGAGQFAPQTVPGKQLLAHELAHVMQQNSPSIYAGPHPGDTWTIQRFEAPEHIDIGESGAQVKVKLANGLELTYGEISALVGDFYETPEKLDKADPAEVTRILKIVREQRLEGGKIASRDVEFQAATQAREKTIYDPATGKEIGKGGQFREGKLAGTPEELETKSFFSLAEENVLHFAPENLRSGWLEGHHKALELAHQSNVALKRGKKEDAEKLRRLALLTDAGYAHFLEDAFSAGHTINPVEVQTWMVNQWNSNPDFKERAIGRLKQAAYAEKWYAPNAIIDKRIDALLRSIPVSVVGSAGLKVLHDYLNRNGIEVINGQGNRWRAFGDYNLWKSPDTKKFAGDAIALSKQQILDALSGKGPDPVKVLQIPPSAVFIPGQAGPVPVGAEVTRRLLPVLESRLVDSDDLWQLLKVAAETQEKAITPFETAELAAASSAEKKRRELAYGDAASKMIKARSGFLGSLDEEKLATDLLKQPDELVEAVLDRLASSDRDDVAYEYVRQIPKDPGEPELRKRSLRLLLRLQAELLTGFVTAKEREQAYRIGSILQRVPEGQKPKAKGEFTTRQMEIAITTATGSAEKAVDEASELKPSRILDATQVAARILIEKHSGFFGLSEDKLAMELKGKPANIIIEVIDQLQDSDDDDDVSLEYMKRVPMSPGEADLRKEDPRVLRRMRQALRSGHVGKDEEAQARRIDTVLGAL
jgi:hypothetical protein